LEKIKGKNDEKRVCARTEGRKIDRKGERMMGEEREKKV